MMYTPRTIRGFTLIEIIVSVGLFSLVMLVVTSAYLSIITIDKEARATNELVANLSFALDSMSRAVRTGTDYNCQGGGNGTCSQLSFTDSTGVATTYHLRSGGVLGQCTIPGCTVATAVPLTDPRIVVTSLVFSVDGVGAESPPEQPEVLISIRGTMMASKGKVVDFTLQTSATQRELEI